MANDEDGFLHSFIIILADMYIVMNQCDFGVPLFPFEVPPEIMVSFFVAVVREIKKPFASAIYGLDALENKQLVVWRMAISYLSREIDDELWISLFDALIAPSYVNPPLYLFHELMPRFIRLADQPIHCRSVCSIVITFFSDLGEIRLENDPNVELTSELIESGVSASRNLNDAGLLLALWIAICHLNLRGIWEYEAMRDFKLCLIFHSFCNALQIISMECDITDAIDLSSRFCEQMDLLGRNKENLEYCRDAILTFIQCLAGFLSECDVLLILKPTLHSLRSLDPEFVSDIIFHRYFQGDLPFSTGIFSVIAAFGPEVVPQETIQLCYLLLFERFASDFPISAFNFVSACPALMPSYWSAFLEVIRKNFSMRRKDNSSALRCLIIFSGPRHCLTVPDDVIASVAKLLEVPNDGVVRLAANFLIQSAARHESNLGIREMIGSGLKCLIQNALEAMDSKSILIINHVRAVSSILKNSEYVNYLGDVWDELELEIGKFLVSEDWMNEDGQSILTELVSAMLRATSYSHPAHYQAWIERMIAHRPCCCHFQLLGDFLEKSWIPASLSSTLERYDPDSHDISLTEYIFAYLRSICEVNRFVALSCVPIIWIGRCLLSRFHSLAGTTLDFIYEIQGEIVSVSSEYVTAILKRLIGCCLYNPEFGFTPGMIEICGLIVKSRMVNVRLILNEMWRIGGSSSEKTMDLPELLCDVLEKRCEEIDERYIKARLIVWSESLSVDGSEGVRLFAIGE
jgi:hypothetical protein